MIPTNRPNLSQPARKRILVMSDSINAKTGYARVAAQLLETLHADGHEVAQLGWYHRYRPVLTAPWATFTTFKNHEQCCKRGNMICEFYQHGKIDYIGLDNTNTPVSRNNRGTYCNRGKQVESDRYGASSINLVIAIFHPDIVISIGDQWMCQSAEDAQLRSTFKHILYAAVDGEPLPHFTQHGSHSLDWQALYENADVALAYCDWGKDTINAMVGSECVKTVIPFGVDSSVFKNLNYETKSELRLHDQRFLSVARTRGGVLWDLYPPSGDDFNILYVGRNIQRKNIPFLIETIYQFKQQGLEDPKRPIRFYLHTPYHDNGWNMDELIRQYDAYEWIRVNPEARPGDGPPDEELNEIYNIADVHFHMSPAEGFDIPCLESLAAGVLTTTLNYSAGPSWGGDALFLVEPAVIRQEPLTNLGRAYPDLKDAVRVLNKLYNLPKKERVRAATKGRVLASRYSWGQFHDSWRLLINSIDTSSDGH